MVKNYNTSKSNTTEIDTGGGDSGAVDHNSTRSNNGIDGGGGGPDPAQASGGEQHRIFDSSQVSSSGDSGAVDHNSTRSNNGIDGGGGGPEPAQGTDYNTTRSNTSSATPRDKHTGRATGKRNSVEGDGGGDLDIHNSTRSNRGAVQGGHDTAKASINNIRSVAGGGGTGITGSTLGIAKTVIMAAVLLTAAGVGFDLYRTYNDAIDLNLEDHVTDADFALNDDKTEINGDIGFNIPEMGVFEKKILAQVHVTVLGSNPTTNGDYSFVYTLGSGEQTYEFSLTPLDNGTVTKINAGENLTLEYTTSITVIYQGIELAPTTTDMPARSAIVKTA